MSKWISRLLNMDNNDRLSEHVFRTRMFASVTCIVFCMAVMISSAYAWFVVDVSSSENVLKSAYYSVSVNIDDEESDAEIDDSSYIYYCGLAKADKHYFTLTATGTAQNGYCKIMITENMANEESENPSEEAEETSPTVYETSTIAVGDSLKVCVQAAEGCKIQFVPVWCAAENVSTFSLRRADVFTIEHSTTPHVEYLVVEGVTLEDLAEYYGVSVEDICIYNGITELTVGEVIRIPGVEDDSVEPYVPVIEIATPSNAEKVEEATPSDATKTENATSSDAMQEEETAVSDVEETETTVPDASDEDITALNLEDGEQETVSVEDSAADEAETESADTKSAGTEVASDSNALESK